MRTAADSAVSERGWALVSVLWFLAMLSLMAAAIQELSVTSARSENRTMLKAQMDAALDAAVITALLSVTAKAPSERWRVDGTEYPVTFEGLRLSARVQDESGRFDLNSVDVTTFATLLRQAGASDDNAEAIADSILNWRGPSNLGTLHGATDEDYTDAGRLYHPRHEPFQSVAELQLVLGMTPGIFAQIAPALTVYTKRPMADAATAPATVLAVLDGGDQEKVADTLAERAGPEQTINPASLNPDIGVMGHVLSVYVYATTNGLKFSRMEVVELTGNPARPYLVLAFN